MLGLELTHRLCVLEAFGERVGQDCIQAIDAVAMLFQQLGGADGGVGHCKSSLAGWT